MIPEDGVVLDIGANIGSMTVVIALTHPGTTVYSFDPIPGSRKALERVILFYGLKNVKVFAHALGNDNGMVEMVIIRLMISLRTGLSSVTANCLTSWRWSGAGVFLAKGEGTSAITGITVPLGPMDQILMASALVITPT